MSLQKGLEHREIIPRDQTTFRCVGNAEQNGKLCTADFREVALGRDSINEALLIEKSLIDSQMTGNMSCFFHLLFAVDFFSVSKFRPSGGIPSYAGRKHR